MPQEPQDSEEAVPRDDAQPQGPADVTPSSLDGNHPRPVSFPVVGVGASAGGLAALEAFFSGMPSDSDTGMAFVIVQHLSPNYKSLLSELVGRYTRMEVSEVVDGDRLEANRVYIIPPDRDLALVGDRLQLQPPEMPHGHRLPIDHFLQSLAAGHGDRSVGVILSGTGSDGTLGIRAIKAEGGLVLAQLPESAEHDGMPRSAIRTGLVDFVLPPQAMAEQLISYTRHVYSTPRVVDRADQEAAMRSIVGLLRAQTTHDFSQYKLTTLLRRVQRRAALHQRASLTDYAQFARESAPEVDALFQDLLIGVTSFFRDPEAFTQLEERVIPTIVAGKKTDETIRVWACGCSTGEEAYSLAILFQEAMEHQKRSCRLQIFATDLDPTAIEAARSGAFPASIVNDVSSERLARFFTHDVVLDAYRVNKPIRDTLVFSEQNVLKDPPFSRLDLITCRNLLIYLNADVQRKLIPLFHYALVDHGFLFLGTSETVGEFQTLFAPIDRKWKIFSREAGESGIARTGFPTFHPPTRATRAAYRPALHDVGADFFQGSLRQVTERALLAHFAEAALLVNGRGDILHIMGRTGRYLEQPTGEPTLNALALSRDGLARELSTALHRAATQRQPSIYRGLRVQADGMITHTDMTVRPVQPRPEGSMADLYLVVLQEGLPLDVQSDGDSEVPGEARGHVARLEQELMAKEDYLQTTLEEMETTNEELKSTNEEMQSVNEELQSTNEELETSKEELQSVNEELSTVNAELQERIAELSRTNNDMNNLLAGTGIGTVFVDHQLHISRFTPAATQVINLIPTDIGRPVEHLAPNLEGYHHLSRDLAEVLRTLVPKEAEVRTRNGVWYLMRIHPYRTSNNVIEGAVLTFVDISARKQAEQALADSFTRFQVIFDCIPADLAQFDLTGRFLFVNQHLCQTLGFSQEELLDRRLHELMPPEDGRQLDRKLKALASGERDFQFRHGLRRRDGAELEVETWLSAMKDEAGAVKAVVAISVDRDGNVRHDGGKLGAG